MKIPFKAAFNLYEIHSWRSAQALPKRLFLSCVIWPAFSSRVMSRNKLSTCWSTVWSITFREVNRLTERIIRYFMGNFLCLRSFLIRCLGLSALSRVEPGSLRSASHGMLASSSVHNIRLFVPVFGGERSRLKIPFFISFVPFLNPFR